MAVTKPDSHIHYSVGIAPETIHLFAHALRYYADRLQADLNAIMVDAELAKILDAESLKSFRITQQIEEARQYADEFEKHLPRAEEWGLWETNLSHGLVRRLKSIARIYLNDLEARRDRVAATHGLTTLGLETLDTKLTQWREKLNLGIFRDAELVALEVASVVSPPKVTPEEIPNAPTDTPLPPIQPLRLATSIELVDPQLRERCLDLFNVFDESNQPHRFDTVVSEATRILENRVRALGGLGLEIGGVDLMTKVFNPKASILRLSVQDAEQEAAHLLFRGAFGFIRNPAHHRLLDTMEKERVIQILGLVDYLLYLAETATKVTATPPA